MSTRGASTSPLMAHLIADSYTSCDNYASSFPSSSSVASASQPGATGHAATDAQLGFSSTPQRLSGARSSPSPPSPQLYIHRYQPSAPPELEHASSFAPHTAPSYSSAQARHSLSTSSSVPSFSAPSARPSTTAEPLSTSTTMSNISPTDGRRNRRPSSPQLTLHPKRMVSTPHQSFRTKPSLIGTLLRSSASVSVKAAPALNPADTQPFSSITPAFASSPLPQNHVAPSPPVYTPKTHLSIRAPPRLNPKTTEMTLEIYPDIVGSNRNSRTSKHLKIHVLDSERTGAFLEEMVNPQKLRGKLVMNTSHGCITWSDEDLPWPKFFRWCCIIAYDFFDTTFAGKIW
ncbi:hypothetical protein SeLEV6574_g05878 [Synchytrium endobioticum]|uniref:Uncharacterized protein n=1 Tax=Synchytrium endobioticum TaxID=286115 RepID=A0A507CS46_9FUNG|nr:hypothetical protein SeLEV6574_g05878 [Synchytrium endobioticum]